MKQVSENQIREAFELFSVADYEGQLGKYADGSYINDALQSEWRIWQACWNTRYNDQAEKLKLAVEALEIFMRCAYPVAKEINPRGYNWSEAYLDDAMAEGARCLAKIIDKPSLAADCLKKINNQE